MCLAHGVVPKGDGLPCPVDLNGRFTAEVRNRRLPLHEGSSVAAFRCSR